jgi:colicin import membrane protein
MTFDLLLTDEPVCTDRDPSDPKAKVVACTSPEAAYQVVGKGAPISAEDAARFGAKTKKHDETNYTLRLDGSTIARTPEDKAYAATLPQPGLVMARAESIRSSAALSVASLGTAAAANAAAAEEEAKKADALADKKLKAALDNKAAPALPKAEKTTAPAGTKAEKAAAKKEAAAAKKAAAAEAKAAKEAAKANG